MTTGSWRPVRRKGMRPGMLVRCPWCGRPGVALTRAYTLLKHKQESLGKAPVCAGSSRKIAYSENGQVVQA